jgi:hypothetical protein
MPPQRETTLTSPSFADDVPEALRRMRTEPLFVMRLAVRPLLVPGRTPTAFRRIGIVPEGEFGGRRLSGIVLDGGSDWQTVRPDGATTLDVRLVLKTVDDALICMTYQGLRHGPSAIIEQLEGGQDVDPASYYFRIAPRFETAAPQYAWLNRILAVGTGHRSAAGPLYSVFEVL